jgi:ADP-ribose pyrophosphatase YjhB (NUDIX family)
MTTKAMVLLLNSAGKHLELRNSADETILPATELKSGEDVRAAAKRSADEFFGLVVPDESIREGFQSRVGNDVIAVYPVDVSKMDMSLLRPAEEAASWAWENVPSSMGHVVALGFPRNLGERRNGLVTKVESFAPAAPGFPSDQHPSPDPGGDSAAVFAALQASVAAKTASLRNVAPHERPAREAELEQEREDLRLMAEDLGIDMSGVRMNAADVPCEKCGKPSGLDYKPSGNAKAYCESCWDSESARMTKTTRSNAAPVTARALIRQNDGTIIAARQKDGRSLLPGGHLENGETPEAAVARELQEELGIDIRQALTGETYDFEGEGLHRVFVVDGSKLDLSKLQPGDDVGG